ncbi:hypothetical protein niasHT_003284 [Heterodera trifolii]|uniref:Uncharacterized protein n=1 Tax=Heterodera trifolii TaxID=157864 RepID=A0ABD2LSK3_9BILA
MNLLPTVLQPVLFLAFVANVFPDQGPELEVWCYEGIHVGGQANILTVNISGSDKKSLIFNGEMRKHLCVTYIQDRRQDVKACVEHVCYKDGELHMVFNLCSKDNHNSQVCTPNDELIGLVVASQCQGGQYKCSRRYILKNDRTIPPAQRVKQFAGPTDASLLNPFVPFDCAENICSGAMGSVSTLFVVVFFTILLTVI